MSCFTAAFFCGECKKLTNSLEDLLFVENDGQVGFCSEPCIEKYYNPLVNHFEEQEKQWRSDNGLADEEVLEIVGMPVFMDELLRRPSEVWRLELDGGDELHSFIAHLEDPKYGEFSMMCLCLLYDNQPSFIICASATKSSLMLENFQWGKSLTNIRDYHTSAEKNENKGHMEIDESTMMELEGKKSRYLASLIEDRSPADIPIESFPLYEEYFEPTMMDPDEIFKKIDDEGDIIYTYIKAYDREGVSFYYFIICYRISEGNEANTDTLIPIVSFPSVDGDMYRLYKSGELISGNLKN